MMEYQSGPQSGQKSEQQAASGGGDAESQSEFSGSFTTYTVGLAFALLLTGASFLVSQTNLLWAPGVPAGLAVLAIAQMGVHLVFFLHISTGPDNTNNVLALAFGVLIVTLVVAGSLWIMANLNSNMIPMDHLLEMQR
jgi:cytochrome o ubiquinol oxidase subunit IV